MEMVRTAVDRVVVLDVGEIIAQGSFEAVVADPEVRRAYLGRTA
jgi:branched-chain amino acid transport system ATP-binding protein